MASETNIYPWYNFLTKIPTIITLICHPMKHFIKEGVETHCVGLKLEKESYMIGGN